ncbi:30S ribosomal protein S5 [Patescibacteria group bacterium]|nr:30S ribosomal protein S5 [Patescibacteria group bacterium]
MRKRFNRREKPEFEQKLVDVARVVRIVAGGRRFRFRATVVIGNQKGKVGAGIGKAGDVSSAITKAVTLAKKKMITVPIVDDTIPHEIKVKYRGAQVFLKPARKGTGIIAGGAVRAVVELAGIRNILSKIQGSSNKPNNVQATIKALELLQTKEQIYQRRGKMVKKKDDSKSEAGQVEKKLAEKSK